MHCSRTHYRGGGGGGSPADIHAVEEGGGDGWNVVHRLYPHGRRFEAHRRGESAEGTRFHIETLMMCKLSTRNFTTQNDVYQ